MDNNDLLSVGHVRKAHGLKGEVVVRLSTNRDERVDKGAVLVVGDTEMKITSSRPKDGDFLVTFAGVTTREQADDLRGTELRAEPIDDPDELWVHELIGAQVVDQDGVSRGEVVAVQSNPASDLLVLDSEFLIPLVFVVSVDSQGDDGARVVTVEVPNGLFDL